MKLVRKRSKSYRSSVLDIEKVRKVANELEDVALLAKHMVIDLREGEPNAYARVYWLRWRLGKVVAELGVGVPSGLPAIAEEYERYLE